MEEKIKCKDILELIYKAEEKTLNEKIKKADKKIKDKIKDINIEKLIENSPNLNELSEIFQKIEENYSIKINEYNKEFYKEGFIDGVNLIINCLNP